MSSLPLLLIKSKNLPFMCILTFETDLSLLGQLQADKTVINETEATRSLGKKKQFVP